MTRRAADPHLRFDEWLLAGARGEPPRDLALHATLCAACTARVAALDLLAAVDPGRATQPPPLASAPRPVVEFGRAGRYAAALAGVTLTVALAGLVGWRLVELRGLTDRVDANAGETPAQGVLGGTGESSASASPDASVAEPSSAAGAATASPVQTAAATVRPVTPLGTPPGATPRPATPLPSASTSPSGSAVSSASATPTPAGSATPAPSEPETPTPSPTPTPAPTETPTPEPTPTPSP